MHMSAHLHNTDTHTQSVPMSGHEYANSFDCGKLHSIRQVSNDHMYHIFINYILIFL